MQPQPRRTHEGAVEAPGVGVDQQLVGIEEIALVRIVAAIGAQPVARAGADIGDQPVMDVVVMAIELEAPDFAVSVSS